MVIGIDARAASEVLAGGGRVVRELLPALDGLGTDHEFRLYCRRPLTDPPLGETFRWMPLAFPDPVWHAAAARRANASCDVFLSTNSYLTPWMLRIPSVALVYDLIAFLPFAHPQRRAARIERATIRPAVRRASRLVCISQSTERDLLAHIPRAAGKTQVVPLAAGEVFNRQVDDSALDALAGSRGVEKGRFVLATGTLEPRKNLRRLIRAHGALPEALRTEYPLLIVGPRGWEEQEILDAAGARGRGVRLAGFVPDADLAGLYQACALFCFPSLYEGFGLPVLEAMAAGAPVLTSRVSSLPEVGNDAVAYVDPLGERSLAVGLERLLDSPAARAELSRRGEVRAAGFSWQRTAGAILHELEVAARGTG